uniref:Uncharacterized protein n=1 Tax=Moumouvirus sp. 'Monve' TaxID=1128131 RepID=H2EF92_9VIRU|nr:hypothetical protein mv_R955 [Moumouvirus Monve]
MTLQHLLKKINPENITRGPEVMIYGNICNNSDVINYLNMLGYTSSDRIISRKDYKIIKELPIIKFLVEIDQDQVLCYFKYNYQCLD